MLTFAFMHHPYLVCILFGMPSLHLYTFLLFSCILIISRRGLQHTPNRGCGTHMARIMAGIKLQWPAARALLCPIFLPLLTSRLDTISQSELSEKRLVWQSFQQSWFNQWTWLHYDEANDLAYCHICVSVYLNNLLSLMSNVTHQVKYPPTCTIHHSQGV